MKGYGVENKYYTILAIPQGKGPTANLRVSTVLLLFIVFTVLTLLLSICYLSYNYIETAGKIKRLASLEQTTILQKNQLNFLVNKVSDFENKMMDLAQFDKKIRMMTNLDNRQSSSPLLGVGGAGPGDGMTVSRAAEVESALIDRIHENMDHLLDESALQEDSFTELLKFLNKQKSILASTPSIWPVIGWVTSEFGYRVSPFTENREFHRGIDIAAEIGNDVVAPADGIVASVAKQRGMGNLVKIRHGGGVETVYGHLLKKSDVKMGQKVKRGDVIGQVGNTGRSTGSHLHYGVCINGVYVNPRRHLF